MIVGQEYTQLLPFPTGMTMVVEEERPDGIVIRRPSGARQFVRAELVAAMAAAWAPVES